MRESLLLVYWLTSTYRRGGDKKWKWQVTELHCYNIEHRCPFWVVVTWPFNNFTSFILPRLPTWIIFTCLKVNPAQCYLFNTYQGIRLKGTQNNYVIIHESSFAVKSVRFWQTNTIKLSFLFLFQVWHWKEEVTSFKGVDYLEKLRVCQFAPAGFQCTMWGIIDLWSQWPVPSALHQPGPDGAFSPGPHVINVPSSWGTMLLILPPPGGHLLSLYHTQVIYPHKKKIQKNIITYKKNG